MLPNPHETADLVTFTQETLNEKLYFLCIAINPKRYRSENILKDLLYK